MVENDIIKPLKQEENIPGIAPIVNKIKESYLKPKEPKRALPSDYAPNTGLLLTGDIGSRDKQSFETKNYNINDAYAQLGDGTFQKRYDTYQEGRDNAEYAAQTQSTTEKWTNGLTKFAGKVGVGIIGGTIGTLDGIYEGIKQGSFRATYDNDFSKYLDDLNEKLDYKLPNYYEKGEKEASFGNSLGSANFWADQVLGGAAFTISAIGSEAIWAYATGGASLAATSARYGARLSTRFLGAESKFARGMEAIAKAKGIASKPVLQTFLNAKLPVELATKFGKAGQMANVARFTYTSAGFESGMEARMYIREMEEGFKSDYEKKNQTSPSKEEVAEFQDKLTNSANALYGFNMAVVGSSNLMTIGRIFDMKSPLTASSKWANSKLFGIGFTENAGKAVIQTATKGQKIAQYSWGLSKSPLIEGVWEEGMQSVGSNTAKNWIQSSYDPKYLGTTVEMSDAFTQGLSQTYGTKEGMKEVGIGMLIGLLTGTGIGAMQGQGIKGELSNEIKKNEKVVDFLNQTYSPHQVAQAIAFSGRIQSSTEAADKADKKGDFTGGELARQTSIITQASYAYNLDYLDETIERTEAGIRNIGNDLLMAEYGVDEKGAEDLKDKMVADYKSTTEIFKKNRDFTEYFLGNKLSKEEQEEAGEANIAQLKDAVAYELTLGEKVHDFSQELLNSIKQEVGETVLGKNIGESLEIENILLKAGTQTRNEAVAKEKKLKNLNTLKERLERQYKEVQKTLLDTVDLEAKKRFLNRSDSIRNQIVDIDKQKQDLTTEYNLLLKTASLKNPFGNSVDSLFVTEETLNDRENNIKEIQNLTDQYNQVNPQKGAKLKKLTSEYAKSLYAFKRYADLSRQLSDPKLGVRGRRNILSELSTNKKPNEITVEFLEGILNNKNKSVKDTLDEGISNVEEVKNILANQKPQGDSIQAPSEEALKKAKIKEINKKYDNEIATLENKEPILSEVEKQKKLEQDVEDIKSKIRDLRSEDGSIPADKMQEFNELKKAQNEAYKKAQRGNAKSSILIKKFEYGANTAISDPVILSKEEKIEAVDIIEQVIQISKSAEEASKNIQKLGYIFNLNDKALLNLYLQDRFDSNAPRIGNNKDSFQSWVNGKEDKVKVSENGTAKALEEKLKNAESNYNELQKRHALEIEEYNKRNNTNFLNSDQVLNGRNEYSDFERTKEILDIANRQKTEEEKSRREVLDIKDEFSTVDSPQLTNDEKTKRKSNFEKLKTIWSKISSKASKNRADLEDGLTVDFTPASEAGGVNIPAHGMGKSSLASALNDLFDLMNNGVNPKRGQGGLDVAPLTAPEVSAQTTAGGHAYREGAFILLGTDGIITSLNDIRGILVNDGVLKSNPEIIDLLRESFPNLEIQSYSNAAKAVETLLTNQIQIKENEKTSNQEPVLEGVPSNRNEKQGGEVGSELRTEKTTQEKIDELNKERKKELNKLENKAGEVSQTPTSFVRNLIKNSPYLLEYYGSEQSPEIPTEAEMNEFEDLATKALSDPLINSKTLSFKLPSKFKQKGKNKVSLTTAEIARLQELNTKLANWRLLEVYGSKEGVSVADMLAQEATSNEEAVSVQETPELQQEELQSSIEINPTQTETGEVVRNSSVLQTYEDVFISESKEGTVVHHLTVGGLLERLNPISVDYQKVTKQKNKETITETKENIGREDVEQLAREGGRFTILLEGFEAITVEVGKGGQLVFKKIEDYEKAFENAGLETKKIQADPNKKGKMFHPVYDLKTGKKLATTFKDANTYSPTELYNMLPGQEVEFSLDLDNAENQRLIKEYQEGLKKVGNKNAQTVQELEAELMSQLKITVSSGKSGKFSDLKAAYDSDNNPEFLKLRASALSAVKEVLNEKEGYVVQIKKLPFVTKIKHIFLGTPNFVYEDGKIKFFKINPKQVVNYGYIENGKLVLKNSSKIVRTDFIKGMMKKNGMPVIVLQQGKYLIAIPVSLNRVDANIGDNFMQGIQEEISLGNSRNFGKIAIQFNQLLKENGLSPKTYGVQFLDANNQNMFDEDGNISSKFTTAIEKLNEIKSMVDVSSWMEKGHTTEKLAEEITSPIDTEDNVASSPKPVVNFDEGGLTEVQEDWYSKAKRTGEISDEKATELVDLFLSDYGISPENLEIVQNNKKIEALLLSALKLNPKLKARISGAIEIIDNC